MPHPPDEWLYGYGVPKNERADDDPISHGSCIASKAAGVINGVSKRSHIVLLKINDSAINVIWAFNNALEHIVNNSRQGRAVVAYPNTARSPSPAGFPRRPWSHAHGFMRDLIRNDVVVVVPSGNYAEQRGRASVDTLLATLESPEFPLIVAGAVDNHGGFAPFSQGPNHVTTWASGVRVRCAKKGNSQGSQVLSGTSFSTATVSSAKDFPRAWHMLMVVTDCWLRRLRARAAQCSF